MMLAACAGSGGDGAGGGILPDRADTVEARLVPKGGSAGRGTVRFAQAANGLSVSIYFGGVAPGAYRMAIHTTGNCTSPNGFSAGPPWVPPGAAGPVVIEFSVDNETPSTLSQRVPALTLKGPLGVDGRSVVIHEGWKGALETEPDVRNSRVACGVIGQVLKFNFF